MRILMFISVFFIFLNCEDKQSRQQKNNSNIDSLATVNSEDKKKAPKIKQRKFPKLTDKNAMDFFLEYEKENKENKVRITTDFGTIDILLYDETKFHRANFIFLTKQGYFDNTQFYRVVENFVIQGGSSDDMSIAERRRKIGKYLLPKDTQHGFLHDRGVISMPSSEIENPYKMASPYQFFIVQQQGGAHHLDGDYTVFGRVTDGMDVVDKIAAQKTDDGEWPLNNIYIQKVEIIN
ncbi:cyclophilin family peptidyl-prolyl cis-trans isomerase [Gelidibacter algens]|uniref:Peptidyl-prolyl cis-trans isomerase n=1 Tax=Gelidibacter algens TaxID=49280 RepID=A0A1A7R5G1_9FLAO|nr:peptidylprolyl isomerase [Gelidibacter algens]OBX27096.1 peptidylprolyl isomerase [Gelidibacter algens]RAJ27945.1 cyclophilin family peptidyl-prolyl cis-trans isomerase [Gelidibacter algens]